MIRRDLASLQRELLATRAAIEEELGIPSGASPRASAPRPRSAPAPKRARVPEVPTRVSSRLSALGRVDMSEAALAGAADFDDGVGVASTVGAGSLGSGASMLLRAPPPLGPPSAPQADSSKSLPARVAFLRDHFLGRFLPSQPPDGSGGAKRAAMATASANARAPRFNKYAGVQEWNNAVFLFVNLFSAGDGGDGTTRAGTFQKNIFSRDASGALLLNWFGSDTAHESSRPLLRLRHAATGFFVDDGGTPHAGGGGASAEVQFSNGSSPAPVCLVTRLAPGTPYVYMGELEFDSRVGAGYPVEFMWRLKDFPALCERARAALGAQPTAARLGSATKLPSEDETHAADLIAAAVAVGGGKAKADTLPDRFCATLCAGGFSNAQISAALGL